jgi:D-glycero-alpha-D-manno-heptose-7-phosphate kinase
MIVLTRTPLRISFFGGGTDFAGFYETGHGSVLSTAIDKYVYVTLKRHGDLFDEPYRLNYSKTEMVHELEDIQNEIGREILRELRLPSPVYISTISDVPSGSGLGSSSSYAVGLLNAVYAFRAMNVTPGDLADMACHIEIDVLKKPIGKQDQYPAAFGGLNHIRFDKDSGVAISPVSMARAGISDLFDHFLFFWTGMTRQADSVLSEQKSNIASRHQVLCEMRDMADDVASRLRRGAIDIPAFGRLMHEAWQMKRKLASNISNGPIDQAYDAAMGAGAWGGKLCGAGNGGFLLFCAPPNKHDDIRAALTHLREIPIGYEPNGSRVLYSRAAIDTQFVLAPALRAR